MTADEVALVSVAGRTRGARYAVRKIRRRNADLGGHFDPKVADVRVPLERAERRCVAAPGLIRIPPPPAWCVAGIFVDAIRVLTGLRLAAE